MTPAYKENPIIPVMKDAIAVPTKGMFDSMPTRAIFKTKTKSHTTIYSPVKIYLVISLKLKASEKLSVLI